VRLGQNRTSTVMTSYKELLVWQRGMDLVETLYRITSKLPTSETMGLLSRMRRASVSVPSNIAEGHTRRATGEYRHYLSIARASLLELENACFVMSKARLLHCI
jgi:four helix bundle protein